MKGKAQKVKELKSSKGITLVALVVTIVVLIILATVSIQSVFGENGLIKKAQEAKNMYEQSVSKEQEAMDKLLNEYDAMMNGNGGGTTPEEPETEYNDETLPSIPKVAEGMTKIKYDSSTNTWKKVTSDNEEWYNYANKEWANVVMPAEGTVDSLFTTDGTLDESKKYVQLVWIPRYAYKITSQYHQSGTGAGDVEVVFVDSSNKDKEGNPYGTSYPTYATGTGMTEYVVHPAFEYDGNHLSGFWMGKFEASNTSCTTTASTGEVAYTGNEVLMTKANVTSWRNLTIGDAFVTALDMNKTGNTYGLNTSDSVVDPHMVKNSEWGACAYLSKSQYGKQTEEEYINNNINYITGIAGGTASASSSADVTNSYNTPNGMKASTTGNATGIYDMSGGNWERVAAYVNNGHANLTTYGLATDTARGGLTATSTPNKYRDVYTSATTTGSDTQSADYASTEPSKASGKYGDAVWETSSSTGSPYTNSWYSDYSGFPYTNNPFFGRGGVYGSTSGAGVFFFGNTTGGAYADGGFRVVVPVL